MEYAKIYLPIEYWELRKEFLKAARSWFCFGKVRMVKTKTDCSIIFYHNTQLHYIVNGAINFGAWLKHNGYTTYHNKFNFKNMGKEPIIYDFEKDIKKIEHILPYHYNYKCELRENGVHCYSETGIPDEEECFWRFFIILLKQSFGERFIEVFHQTCTNHKKFTVYLKMSDGKNF